MNVVCINVWNEDRRSGCSGENLRGLGLLVLHLFTVTSAEESEGERESKR